jgi:hypothetical protein
MLEETCFPYCQVLDFLTFWLLFKDLDEIGCVFSAALVPSVESVNVGIEGKGPIIGNDCSGLEISAAVDLELIVRLLGFDLSLFADGVEDSSWS